MIPSLKRPNALLFILLLAPFVKPVGLDAVPLADKLFLLWKLAALAYMAVALLPKLIQPVPKKKPASFIGLIVFWVIYLAGCLRVGADVVTVAVAAVSSLFVLLLISYEVRIGNGMLLLRAMAILFTACILAHIASVFLVELGILNLGEGKKTPVYLFGMDNYSAFFLYPMLTLVLYYNRLHRGRFGWSGWALLASTVAIYLLTRSMTAAGAGLLMILLLLPWRSWKRLPQIRGVRWMILAMAVFLVLICGFQIQQLLASMLDAMSKGVTLNSRTIIWDHVLRLIQQRPVFGHGSFTQEQIYKDYVMYGTTHAHNLLMELLLRTGIVGTIAYLWFLLGFAPIGKRNPLPGAHGVLMVGLVTQLVLFFMDYYPNITVFYIFMGVLYCSGQFATRAPEEDKT